LFTTAAYADSYAWSSDFAGVGFDGYIVKWDGTDPLWGNAAGGVNNTVHALIGFQERLYVAGDLVQTRKMVLLR
jgi:hypothetical protein